MATGNEYDDVRFDGSKSVERQDGNLGAGAILARFRRDRRK